MRAQQTPVCVVINGSCASAANPVPVTSDGGTSTTNVAQWASGVLGAMANYGTSPGAVLVPGFNAFVTNAVAITAASLPLPTNAAQETGGNLATLAGSIISSIMQSNVKQWAGGTIGAMANYGTSPGAVLSPGVNAFITNAPTVTSSPGLGITPTDHTITSASGASQQIMAANASRHSLTIENTGNANCGVNPTGGTAAIGGAGTLTLAPLGSYSPQVPTLSAVTVICTAAQPIYGDDN